MSQSGHKNLYPPPKRPETSKRGTNRSIDRDREQ